MWHGSKNKSLNFFKNFNQINNKHTYKKTFKTLKKIQNFKLLNTVYVPSFWKLMILTNLTYQKQHVYLYSKTYFFRLPIPNYGHKTIFDKNSSLLKFNSIFINTYSKLFFKNVNNFLTLFTIPIFKKIKFKGKGYYIYKNYRNTVTPQFGHSHRIYIYSFFTPIKFLSKTSILIFGINKNDILNTAKNIKLQRPINIFTGRGVRFAKQLVYKKAGKVSTYR